LSTAAGDGSRCRRLHDNNNITSLATLAFQWTFTMWTWIRRFPLSGFFLHLFCLRISSTGFFTGQMSSCHPTASVKALKETQSSDPNQPPDLILCSSTNKLLKEYREQLPLKEAELLPLRQ